MKTIYVDLNAGPKTTRISFTTRTLKSLADNEAREGDWVWLSDGDVRVVGNLVDLEARVYWHTKEDVPGEPPAPACKRCGKDDEMQSSDKGAWYVCRRCLPPESPEYTAKLLGETP